MRAPNDASTLPPSPLSFIHVQWLDLTLSGYPLRAVAGRVHVRLACVYATRQPEQSAMAWHGWLAMASWYVKAWCRYRGSTVPSAQDIFLDLLGR